MENVIRDIADMIVWLNQKEPTDLYDYVETLQRIEFCLIAAGFDTEHYQEEEV